MKLHVPLGQFLKLISAFLYIKIRVCCIPAAYALSTSCVSSLKVGYSKQPILGLNAGVLLGARVRRMVAFETIKLIDAKVLCTIVDINYHKHHTDKHARGICIVSASAGVGICLANLAKDHIFL